MAAIYEQRIPFDTLDAAIDACLPGYAPGWVEFQRREKTRGSVVYQLSQNELGELGTVTIRKNGDEWSILEVGNPPRPMDRNPTPEELAAIAAIEDPEEKRAAYGELSAQIWAESKALYARRCKHLEDVVMVLLARLADDPLMGKQWSMTRAEEEQSAIRQAELMEERRKAILASGFQPDLSYPQRSAGSANNRQNEKTGTSMTNRDDFPQRIINILADRAGNRCSNPNCRKPTSGPRTDPTAAVNIGVAAHITAAAPGGPRYDSSLTPEQRSHPDNGIWLCQNCAKLIDNDPYRYPTDVLREWKAQAEQAALDELEKCEPLRSRVGQVMAGGIEAGFSTAEKGKFVTEIEVQRLDVAGFEGILATLDDYPAQLVEQTGTAKTWRVGWKVGRELPLGYVLALPLGDRLILRFYEFPLTPPGTPPHGTVIEVDEAGCESVSCGSDDRLWAEMLVNAVKSAFQARGLLSDASPMAGVSEASMGGGVSIERIEGGIHGSIIAGRDIVVGNLVHPVEDRTGFDTLQMKVAGSSPDDWSYDDSRGVYIYLEDALLQIHQKRESERRKFPELWAQCFPDPVAYLDEYELYYSSAFLKRYLFVAVDGFRMTLPFPKSASDLRITRDQYRVGKVINMKNEGWHQSFEEYLKRARIVVDDELEWTGAG